MQRITSRNLIFFSILAITACSKTVVRQDQTIGAVSTTTSPRQIDSNTVSLTEATQVALGFAEKRNHSGSISVKDAETITDKSGKPYIHVVNFTNGGFVLASAEKRYRPILAFNGVGGFETTNLSPGVAMWLDKQASNIRIIRSINNKDLDSISQVNQDMWKAMLVQSTTVPDLYAENNALKKNTARLSPDEYPPGTPLQTIEGYYYDTTTVGPLINTVWGQYCGYDQYCPTNTVANDCYHDVTGCTPLAMAEIMYFWKVPNNYDFVHMYPDSGNTANAKLIADIGLSPISSGTLVQFASYDASNTTCDDTYAPYVFSLFGYNNVSRSEPISAQITGGGQNGTVFKELLSNEVYTNHRPCMLAGSPSENDVLGIEYPTGTRHEWVCEGVMGVEYYKIVLWTYYDPPSQQLVDQLMWGIQYAYMDWGQYGANNAWFDCETDYTAYAPGEDYQYFQIAVYNIYPS